MKLVEIKLNMIELNEFEILNQKKDDKDYLMSKKLLFILIALKTKTNNTWKSIIK